MIVQLEHLGRTLVILLGLLVRKPLGLVELRNREQQLPCLLETAARAVDGNRLFVLLDGLGRGYLLQDIASFVVVVGLVRGASSLFRAERALREAIGCFL